MSGVVRLRPVREDDLPTMERLAAGDPESTGVYGWFGFGGPPFRRRFAEDGLLGEDGGVLMVDSGGDTAGLVSWRKRITARSSYCWNIGIALLPAARGRGLGTEAQRLLARYLFAHTRVHRIEADTELGNVAEQRALEKAGFTREGVTRGGGWRDGAWRDGVVYSLLRTDPAAG